MPVWTGISRLHIHLLTSSLTSSLHWHSPYRPRSSSPTTCFTICTLGDVTANMLLWMSHLRTAESHCCLWR
ncbi:hypothetical protein BKA62DRAFT_687491 [Auriculariales sp. MPI-PUGE-AT-0066]|nr:hypothetical protein BKA62DRAFT_687491 [Auriculariales sp. MPI-PUGE-AT-0066]